MNKEIKMKKGFFYPNDFWLSSAYLGLNKSARDLLQCLVTEISKVKRMGKWVEINNGKLSFSEISYKALTGRCSSTYLNARNELIKRGIIEMTHRGGGGAGDSSMYKILFGIKSMPKENEKWRRYPKENWEKDIPKSKGITIGIKTRWKKGQSGRKVISHPNRVYP